MTASVGNTRSGNDPSLAAPGKGLLLAGDIGGTKTALAVCSSERGPRAPLLEAEFPSAKYTSLALMVREFLAKANLTVEFACFDVAGPVFDGRAKITNLPWILGEAELAAELGLRRVVLLNDLEACGIAIPTLQPDELHTLNAGEPQSGGALAVVAPGTGLGEAFILRDGARYRSYPSEGGHADFAPATEPQAQLLVHLMRRFGHVSVERVCSGPGLYNIYDYLRESGHRSESEELANRLGGSDDRPQIIGEAALRHPNPDPLSHDALQLFVSILGAEAGNLALKVLSTGGLYLAGGIPKRILPALADGNFMRAFVAKGRMGEMLARIPVHVVLRRAPLLGATLRGFELAATTAVH